MRKRQQTRPSNNNNFWDQIWAAHRQYSASHDGGEPQAKHTATATNFASTVWSTAYITIHVPTSTQWPTVAPKPSSTGLRTASSSTISYSAISSLPANSTIAKSPQATWVAPSSHETRSADSTIFSSLETANAAVSEAPTAGTTMGPIAESLEPMRKRAIIGGLSGTIAGLVAIGLVICLILRRRRKQKEARDYFEASTKEGEYRPASMEKFTGFATVMPVGKGSPRSSHNQPPSTTQIAVDEDHRIIRMSTRHWPRPYALAGEGYRESAPAGQLHVVNPDPSRPTTPRRPSIETVGSYWRKQQSALAGFVLNLPRSARQSRSEQTMRSRETPTITVVDPALSCECVPASTTTPSLRSHHSLTSSPTIRPYPPEDPFLTPVQDFNSQLGDTLTPPVTASRRPSASPLQNAAGTASKTLSNLSNTLLQPFRAKSSNLPVLQTPQKNAHLSTSTYSSRRSRRSDPFDLDRPSIRGSHYIAGGAVDQQSEANNSRISLYEGT